MANQSRKKTKVRATKSSSLRSVKNTNSKQMQAHGDAGVTQIPEKNKSGLAFGAFLVISIVIAITLLYSLLKSLSEPKYKLGENFHIPEPVTTTHKYKVSPQESWQRLVDEWDQLDNIGAMELTLIDEDSEYRGAVAKRKVTVGETVMIVPRDKLLTTNDVASGSGLQGIDGDVSKLVSSWARKQIKEHGESAHHCILAVALLWHRYATLNQETKFSVYVNSLPTSSGGLTRHFSREELSLLHGTGVLARAKERETEIDQEYEEIRNKRHVWWAILEPFSLDDYAWARDMVDTRAFGISIRGKEVTAMIPFADIPNHSFNCSMTWHFSDKQQAFIAKSDCNHTKGDSISMYYGNKENTMLLAHYGFALENNPYDCVELIIVHEDADESKIENNEQDGITVLDDDIAVSCYLEINPEGEHSQDCLLTIFDYFLKLNIQEVGDASDVENVELQANVDMWEYIAGQAQAWVEFMSSAEMLEEEKQIHATSANISFRAKFALLARRSEREVWQLWRQLSNQKLDSLDPRVCKALPSWLDPPGANAERCPLIFQQ